MQNSTPNQMLMLLTRSGLNSRIVITGDLQQSDLGEKNGLKDLLEKMSVFKQDNFHFVRLNETDVQRSKLVGQVLDMYKKEELAKSFQSNVFHLRNKIVTTNTTTATTNNDQPPLPFKPPTVSIAYPKITHKTLSNHVETTKPIANLPIPPPPQTTPETSRDTGSGSDTEPVTSKKRAYPNGNSDAAIIPAHHLSKNWRL
jgi:hypothetical protein